MAGNLVGSRPVWPFTGIYILARGQQGDDPGELTSTQNQIAETLAREWLGRVAGRATKDRTRVAGARELAYLSGQMGAEQGGGAIARSAIGGLSRVSWFAPHGMGFAERFVNRALAQVSRYLSDDTIRSAAIDCVLRLVGPETRVLIGHSLGSVVAYEAAHRIRQPLQLLLTLGSPLGLQTIVYQRLRPQPPGFPPAVRRWINVADRDDFIAAEADLTGFFGVGKPPSSVFEGGYTVDNGAEPHNSDFYLGKAQVGRPVREAFVSESTPDFA